MSGLKIGEQAPLTHTLICTSETDALCEHIWCEADLEGVSLSSPREQMSLALPQYFPLILSLSISSTVSRSLFLFSFDQMERCSFPNPVRSAQSKSCDPAWYLPSLSIHKQPALPLSQCPPPPTKADKGLSFLPGLPALCVFVLYQTGLPLSLYSFLFLQKKVSRAPGAPASSLGGRASAVRESILFHLALWCSAGIGE